MYNKNDLDLLGEELGLCIMSIMLKNPFIGNFLLKLKFHQSVEIDKYYISESLIVFYNIDYIKRFDKNSLRHLLIFTFFYMVNRINNEQKKLETNVSSQLNLQISAEACINSYIESKNLAKFKVDGINLFKHYNKKLLDFNHYDMFELINSGIITFDDSHTHLIDFIPNKILESTAKFLSRSAQNGSDQIISNLQRAARGMSHIELENIISGMSGGSFFDIEKMVSFLKNGDVKVNWKAVVKAKISGLFNGEYRLRPMTNLGIGGRVIPLMPRAVKSKKIVLSVGIDVSSSISEKIIEIFVNELFNITSLYSNYEINIWAFTTTVDESSYAEYSSSGNRLNADNVINFNIGGGTLFESNWDFMKSKKLKPDLFILFTDGYPFKTWGDPDYCDTIFIILNDDDFDNGRLESPFGKTIHINNIK